MIWVSLALAKCKRPSRWVPPSSSVFSSGSAKLPSLICREERADGVFVQDGTYALEVGQMSELIESDSGVHIILRTA